MRKDQKNSGQIRLVKNANVTNHGMTKDTEGLSFVAGYSGKVTMFWNPNYTIHLWGKTPNEDIPTTDYAGVVIIHMQGYYRPPLVLMLDDNSISVLIRQLEDENESEIRLQDMGGVAISILKRVILYIEIPHAENGFKAIEAVIAFDPEEPYEEPEIVPVFNSYFDGMAVQRTSEGFKRTPMKYKSWKAKIRREKQRSLQKTKEGRGLNS